MRTAAEAFGTWLLVRCDAKQAAINAVANGWPFS